MVPEVNKYAIRNGRVAAACVLSDTAITSVKAKNIAAKHHGELVVLFIAEKKVVDLRKKCGRISRPVAHTGFSVLARFITALRSITTRKIALSRQLPH
jgi:hypothetical protein